MDCLGTCFTRVYSYVAMAPLALIAACVIADFDRQSFVKETQPVRQSKQKNKTVTFSVAETHTKHKFPSKQRQKNRCVETIKTQNELKKTMYFQLPTLNPAKKREVHYKKVHETTAP